MHKSQNLSCFNFQTLRKLIYIGWPCTSKEWVICPACNVRTLLIWEKNCVDMAYESNIQIQTGNINQASRLVFIIKSGSHLIVRWQSAEMWRSAKKKNNSYVSGNCKRVKIIWVLFVYVQTKDRKSCLLRDLFSFCAYRPEIWNAFDWEYFVTSFMKSYSNIRCPLYNKSSGSAKCG